MYCRFCGHEIEDNHAFCRHCGKPTGLSSSYNGGPEKTSIATRMNGKKILNFIKKKKWWILYLLWVVVNFLLMFADTRSTDRYGRKPTNYTFPFNSDDLFFYDFTEFIFYSLFAPFIFIGGILIILALITGVYKTEKKGFKLTCGLAAFGLVAGGLLFALTKTNDGNVYGYQPSAMATVSQDKSDAAAVTSSGSIQTQQTATSDLPPITSFPEAQMLYYYFESKGTLWSVVFNTDKTDKAKEMTFYDYDGIFPPFHYIQIGEQDGYFLYEKYELTAEMIQQQVVPTAPPMWVNTGRYIKQKKGSVYRVSKDYSIILNSSSGKFTRISKEQARSISDGGPQSSSQPSSTYESGSSDNGSSGTSFQRERYTHESRKDCPNCDHGACRNCKGVGKIQVQRFSAELDRYEYVLEDCPSCNHGRCKNCDGTGKVGY